MQSNQHTKYNQTAHFFTQSDDENNRHPSFADSINHVDDDDQICNIFDQGNMLLRNEESEFVQEDVGSLGDADLNSQSHSDDESQNEEKMSLTFNQATPSRQTILQQATRYGELMMTSPDMQQRHTPFMPVYSQEDEEIVEINQPNIGTSNQLSHRHSEVSEEDFYVGAQYCQGTRLFPHDMSHYGFPQLSQPSQADLHHLNYQQSQSHYLHGQPYANDNYFYKQEDRSLGSNEYDQGKKTLSQSQKPDPVGQDQVPAQYMAFKQSVFQKLILPSDQGESVVDDAQPDFDDPPQTLSDSKLIKITEENDQSQHESNAVSEYSKSHQSESCRVHQINVNESLVTTELKNTRRDHSQRIGQAQRITPASASKPSKKKADLELKKSDLQTKQIVVQDQNQSEEKKDAQNLRLVKGKRRTPRERKYFEKRKKLVEQVIPSVHEIGSFEWDNLILKLQKIPDGTAAEKLNPYTAFNTATFWFYISSLYFPKCYESTLKERLCLLVNFIRGDGSSKHWEKVFRDHPTFLRKSYRVYQHAKRRLNREYLKKDGSQKKLKEQKQQPKEREPTEIEDLICQLENDQVECALGVDRMVCGLLDKINQKKRPRLDSASDEGQIINLIQKNSGCQQSLAFYQELYSFNSKESLQFIALEENRFNEIKTQKLKQLREQYEKARAEGQRDYIMAEPVGKSFLGMLRNSYESCFICNGDDYDSFNLKMQCSVCEYFVHSECLGENVQTLQGEGDVNNSVEAVWTCQSCLVDQGLRKKFPGIDVSFKPECTYCGLTGGLMRGTTNVLPDIRKTPGCNNATSWSASSTNGITLSNLTRKEKDYQIKLTEAKIKHWQDLNDNKPFPRIKEDQEMNSQDDDSSVTLPEIPAYPPSFVYWVHMSCAQWILQKTLIKKKPIVLKQVPSQSHSTENCEECEICGGKNGLMQTCTYNKIRSGEDKMLELMYREFAQDSSAEITNDKVASEFLEQLIEGGVCDSIQHPHTSAKFQKGYMIDVCNRKMHIECARRAENHMKYDSQIDHIEFFCSLHTPLPMHTELKQSLDEQVANIVDFADSYQQVMKESQQIDKWTDKDKFDLFTKVAETFFEMTKLCIPVTRQGNNQFEVQNGPAELKSIEEGLVGLLPGNQDWKITLSYHEFPWQSITLSHYDSIDCWKKYWESIGLSEVRFRNLVMGTSKRSQARYQNFLKLRQLKISSDAKEQNRSAKPSLLISDPSPVECDKQLESQAEISRDIKLEETSEKLPLIAEEKSVKKKLTLRISTPQEQIKRISLRPRPDRTIKPPDFKPNLTPKPAQEKVVLETKIEPIPDLIRISNSKSLVKNKNVNWLQKRKVKKDFNYSKLNKVESCYCKCLMAEILELKNLKKSLKQPDSNEENEINSQLLPPKFNDKVQEELYMQQLNAPGTRFSKSGITRCSNKHDCKLGGYFHVECCYNADKKFDMKKKARDKWFCLACKEQGNVLEPTSQSAPLKKTSQVKLEAVANVSNEVSEIKTASPKKDETIGKKSPNLKRRAIRRLQIKPLDQIIIPAQKRPKLNETSKSYQPLIDNAEKIDPNTEPVILIQESLPIIVPKELQEVIEKPKVQKEEPSLQGVPLINNLLQQVESSLPNQISQQHQDVFQQLKNAIEKYKISMNPTPMAELQLQEQKQPVYGEIEIKFDPVIKPAKQSVKRAVNPSGDEKSKSPQKTSITFDLQKPIETKLTLSQQFQLNLQRKQQAAQSEQIVQLPITYKVEDFHDMPIQLKIEKQPSRDSKVKAKSKAEVPQKSTKLDVEMYTQPVTIAYFNQQQTGYKNEQTKSIQSVQQNQRNSNSSGSPPYQQNPLEPKLAAGPASGYPQQYNQNQSTQQNGMYSHSTFQQPEIPFHDQIRHATAGDESGPQNITVSAITEAELQRKQEKRERKRQRKAERAERMRLEVEQNLIHIETIQPTFFSDIANPSVVSICTTPMQQKQLNQLNLVQLSTTTAGPASEKPNKKKQKKPKQKGVDIMIETTMPASMISIQQPYNYLMPFEQPNQISIPTNGLLNQVSIQMPTYQPLAGFQPQLQIPQVYSMPFTSTIAQPKIADDPFIISIPMAQQIPMTKQSEVVLILGESKKKGKSQTN